MIPEELAEVLRAMEVASYEERLRVRDAARQFIAHLDTKPFIRDAIFTEGSLTLMRALAEMAIDA